MAQSDLVEQAATLLGGSGTGVAAVAERLAAELLAVLRSHGVAELERAAGDVLRLIGASRAEAAAGAAPPAA